MINIVEKIAKIKYLLLLPLIVIAFFVIPSEETKAAPSWYWGNAYAWDNKGNIAIPSSADWGGYATTRFATVGYRIWFGSSNQYYVDLAKDQYYALYGDSKTSTVRVTQTANAGVTQADEQMEGNTVYTLFIVNYSTFKSAVKGKYGISSDAYQYILPPDSGTKTIHLVLDPIMTSAHISDGGASVYLASGYAYVGSNYQVSWSGSDWYGSVDGMCGYWGNLTGNYSPADIINSYHKTVDMSLSKDAEQQYTQTTYHVKYLKQYERYQKDSEAFSKTEKKKPKDAYYAPTYTTVPTGYVKAGIDKSYYVTGNTVTHAYYNPISYTVNYLQNGATGGTMSYSTYWYDWTQALKKNAYIREYTVNFNGSLGVPESESLTAKYDFNGWNYREDGKYLFVKLIDRIIII